MLIKHQGLGWRNRHIMISFKAFVKSKDNIAAAEAFAADNKLPDDVVQKGGIKAAFENLESDSSIDFLLVELSTKDAKKSFEELDELANYVDPATKVIVCGTVDELSFYKELMEMGVQDYLLNPVKKEQIDKATAKKAETTTTTTTTTTTKAEKAEAIAREDSRVIVVCGTRGGVGASSLAVNLAGIFAQRDYPTAILDLDPEFGTIPLMVDVDPSRGLVDAFEKPERVDSLFLDRVMVKVNDNLFVMGAEKQIMEPANISNDAARQIINQLKAKFAYVIVDVSRIQPYEHYALQNYETIITTELSIGGLRDTMRVFDLVSEQLKNKDVFIAASRVGLNKKFETPQKDFENGLGRKIDFVIPFEQQYYGFNDSGKILALENIKKSPLIEAYKEIAANFMPEAVGVKKGAKKKGGFSLFSGGKKK